MNINIRDRLLVAQTLPCAEKNCNSQMTLIENNDKTLGYSCLLKPDEHNFRYTIAQKKWEKIVIKTKLILNYNKNPCEEFLNVPSNVINEFKTSMVPLKESKKFSKLTEIKGIGPKRAKELENAGVKTVSELAKLSPKHTAEKTGIPIEKISNWIIEANKLLDKEKILITT